MKISAIRIPLLIPATAGSLFVLAGCTTVAPAEETAARECLEKTRREMVAGIPEASALGAGSRVSDYVRFALLRHPAVAASFNEWRASVEAIAPARALPDPQVTFQADIAETVLSAMPGVMFDLMHPAKRAAMAREASAAAEVARLNYLAAVVRTAAGVRRACIELVSLDETLLLRKTSLAFLEQTAAFAAADYATGRGMATLEPQVRADGECARARSEIAGLDDRLRAAQTRLKAALGLRSEEADPPWPRFALVPTAVPAEGELWARIQRSNPELAAMRAMVGMTVAQEEVARQEGRPDFAAGLMADVQQAPWMWRPAATMTLPFRRGKTAGRIASAGARSAAARSGVDAGLLDMAVELARMLAMVREADRVIAFIDANGLPNAGRAAASAEAALRSGMGGAAMISEARAMEIAMRIERVAALRDRELAITDLTAMTADAATGVGTNTPDTQFPSNP